MKTLVEMFIFYPLYKPHQNCSMASRFAVPIRWYNSFISSFQLCINQFANNICRVQGDKIGSVRLAETQHHFFRPHIATREQVKPNFL